MIDRSREQHVGWWLARRPRARASDVLSIDRTERVGDLRVHASRASNEHMSCYLRAGHYSLPDLLYFMLRGWTRDSSGSRAAEAGHVVQVRARVFAAADT